MDVFLSAQETMPLEVNTSGARCLFCFANWLLLICLEAFWEVECMFQQQVVHILVSRLHKQSADLYSFRKIGHKITISNLVQLLLKASL